MRLFISELSDVVANITQPSFDDLRDRAAPGLRWLVMKEHDSGVPPLAGRGRFPSSFQAPRPTKRAFFGPKPTLYGHCGWTPGMQISAPSASIESTFFASKKTIPASGRQPMGLNKGNQNLDRKTIESASNNVEILL